MSIKFGRFLNKEKKDKLIYQGTTPEDKPRMGLTRESVYIANSTGSSGIAVTEKFGTGILGPVTFMQTPEEIRMAALWKINDTVLTALPSTIYTPIPMLKPSIPTYGIQEMSTSVAIAMAGLAVVVGG